MHTALILFSFKMHFHWTSATEKETFFYYFWLVSIVSILSISNGSGSFTVSVLATFVTLLEQNIQYPKLKEEGLFSSL